METEKECLIVKLAMSIQENARAEAEAIVGYTDLLGIIDKLLALASDSQETKFLERLRDETEEKISDELNHQEGLLMEYVEFTGIKINKD